MRPLTRYLVRLANNARYTPKDIQHLSNRVRTILGSRESASHFRVGSKALEFNLFARDMNELEKRKTLLESKLSKIVELKQLDTAPAHKEMSEALQEGIQLFNQERFWECHEVLEEIWHPAKGKERDVIQGLILTAAAFVHFQKGEDDICLSVLRRAQEKMGSESVLPGMNLERFKRNIDAILDSKNIQLFTIK